MSLSSQKDGRYIVLRCDICGERVISLRRVNGHWLNPKTKRKAADNPAWVCSSCLDKMRWGGAR